MVTTCAFRAENDQNPSLILRRRLQVFLPFLSPVAWVFIDTVLKAFSSHRNRRNRVNFRAPYLTIKVLDFITNSKAWLSQLLLGYVRRGVALCITKLVVCLTVFCPSGNTSIWTLTAVVVQEVASLPAIDLLLL